MPLVGFGFVAAHFHAAPLCRRRRDSPISSVRKNSNTWLLLAQTPAAPQTAGNTDHPDATMMVPVTALASYMAHVEGAALPPVFVDDGLVIIEDFAPYLFVGKNGAAEWDSGFRHHAIPLKDLEFTFGPAHAFERTGHQIYFVLPTTWRGTYKDRRFEEHGAWSFVLTNTSGH